jgi:hypothetical protein
MDVDKIIARIKGLTRVVAGKMSKSSNYQMIEFVPLEEVLEILRDEASQAKLEIVDDDFQVDPWQGKT